MQYIFRGLTADNQWVYGSLIQRTDGIGKLSLIEVQDKEGEITVHQVKDDSVGLYIDRRDNQGKQIFPGDILLVKARGKDWRTLVRWNGQSSKYEGSFLTPDGSWIENGIHVDAASLSLHTIIGNCFDNTELVNPTAQEQL
jgi:hypothetical protein